MRYVWFAALVLSSWASAFGIAVGVHEWRDESPVAVEKPVIAAETGPSKAELDAQKCEAALEAAGDAVSSGPVANPVGGFAAYPNVPEIIQHAINRYCR